MQDYQPDIPLFSLHIPKTGGTTLYKILENWYTNRFYFPDCRNHPSIYSIVHKHNIDNKVNYITKNGFVKHYYHHHTRTKPNRVNLNKLIKRRGSDVCVHGHFPNKLNIGVFDYYPSASQFITLIRDPLDMALSMYNYRKTFLDNKHQFKKINKENKSNQYNRIPINNWIEKYELDFLDFFPFELTLKNFKKVIEKYFIHILVLEDFTNSVEILAGKLNKRKPEQVDRLNQSINSHQKLHTSTVKKFKEKYKLEYAIYEFAKSINNQKKW